MSTGGGGYIPVGGISADVKLETGSLDAQLAKVEGGLAKTAAAMARWQAQFDGGKITAAQLDSALGPLIAHQDELRASYDRITQAMAAGATATTTVHAGMARVSTGASMVATTSDKATSSGRNLGMMFMQLGAMADDVQYGFMGIVNNVAPLVMGMTGSMGIAAAAQVVTVGLYQLTRHWEEFMDAIGFGVIQTEAEAMEKLGKATARTADEQSRLNKYKREQKEIEQIMAGRPAQEKATEAGVEKAFAESDPEKVRGAIAGYFQRQRKLTPAEAQAVLNAGDVAAMQPKAFGGGGGNVPVLAPAGAIPPEEIQRRRDEAMQTAMNRIQAGIQKEVLERAQKLMGKVTMEGPEGEQAVAELKTIIDSMPGEPAFRKGLLGDILKARPGDRKAQAALEARAKGNAEDKARREKEIDDEFERSSAEAEDTGKKLAEANRKNTERARRKAPGAEMAAERLALISRASGGTYTMDQVVEEVSAYLETKGLSKTQAYGAAADFTRGAARKAEGEIAREALTPPRHAQVFDSTDLAGKIQSGVGGDTMKDLVKHAAKSEEYLRTLADQKAVTLRIKP